MFCTVPDMADWLQIEILNQDAAIRAIHEATAAIQSHCRQILSVVEDDTYTFDVPAGRRRLFLPELPIIEVTTVTEDGETLTLDTDYKLGANGVLFRVGQPWSEGYGNVEVVYSHGYAAIPQLIQEICTRAAGRAYQAGLRTVAQEGVPGVQALTLGDYSVQYGSDAGNTGEATLGASAAPLRLRSEKELLNRFRI